MKITKCNLNIISTMIHKTIALPEQDLGLFLELIRRFRWKEENQNPQSETNKLTPAIIAELDKRMEHYKHHPETAMDNDEVIKLLKLDEE